MSKKQEIGINWFSVFLWSWFLFLPIILFFFKENWFDGWWFSSIILIILYFFIVNSFKIKD